jgi:hydroxyacylglutathione hydrolase
MEELTILHTGPLSVNTYILPLAEDTVLIVDPAACSFTGDEDKITGWLREHGRRPAGIFVTHGHFDHITGLGALKRAYPSCPVAIHTDDAQALGSNSVPSQISFLPALGLEGIETALQDVPAADIVFQGGETLDMIYTGGYDEKTRAALSEWKIIHTPGHSKGSCCLYNAGQKKLISGDTFFYRSYGRTDLGGNENEMIHSLALLKKILPPDTTVYPGHDYYGFLLSDGL